MISLDVSVQLRGTGLRVTAPRLPVLRWLAGHAADEAEVVFWGICPTCQASTDNDHTKPIRYEEAR